MTEQATQLVEYSVTNVQLIELAAKYPVVPDAATTEGYQAIKECLSEVRPLRTAVETRRKELKADALSYGRKVDARAKEITEALLDIETPFKEAKVAEDQKAEKAAQAAREAEEQRILKVQGRIADIHKQAEGLLNATSGEINARITAVIDVDMGTFEEFVEPARLAKDFVIDSLQKALYARMLFETQQVEQEQIAKAQAEKQAELDKQAEEQLKEMEARQAEIDSQQKKVDEERREAAKVMQEAQDKADAEKRRKEQEIEDAKNKEAAKVMQEAEELKVKREAEREAKRQEMLRPDKEIVRDWVLKLRFIDGPDWVKDPLMMKLVQDVMMSLSDLAAKTVEKMERI